MSLLTTVPPHHNLLIDSITLENHCPPPHTGKATKLKRKEMRRKKYGKPEAAAAPEKSKSKAASAADDLEEEYELPEDDEVCLTGLPQRC